MPFLATIGLIGSLLSFPSDVHNFVDFLQGFPDKSDRTAPSIYSDQKVYNLDPNYIPPSLDEWKAQIEQENADHINRVENPPTGEDVK